MEEKHWEITPTSLGTKGLAIGFSASENTEENQTIKIKKKICKLKSKNLQFTAFICYIDVIIIWLNYPKKSNISHDKIANHNTGSKKNARPFVQLLYCVKTRWCRGENTWMLPGQLLRFSINYIHNVFVMIKQDKFSILFILMVSIQEIASTDIIRVGNK